MLTNRLLVLTTCCVVGLAACQSTPDGSQTAAPVDERNVTARPSTTGRDTATPALPSSNVVGNPIGPTVTAQSNVGGRGDPALRDPKSLLSQRSIYFDYDGFIVSPDYKALMEAHAKYLTSNRNARMRIEGNTDERGSREYNLALGQRRADAVRRALTLLGVNDSQIETVSFGEEKPRATGTSEDSWRENRRADIVYAGE